jgi:hypothetical protein
MSTKHMLIDDNGLGEVRRKHAHEGMEVEMQKMR